MTGRTIGCPDAEVALLGCLMRTPAGTATALARRVLGGDLVDPRNRTVLAAVAAVASQGHDPDPVLVLGQLRRRGIESSFTDDKPAGAYLADVYTAACTPSSVEAYLRIVLEHAYRRRIVETACRLAQHAGGLALDELQALLDQEVAQVHALAARARPAAVPGARVQAIA